MRAVLLPVKDLASAKRRLAPVLTPLERRQLAQAMLEDVVNALLNVRLADKIFVVTSFEPAIQLAASNGWEVLREGIQTSESVSVDWASQQCAERGITALLRLPLDIPLVESRDIDELLAASCTAPGVVMVPSRDATGTNAILRTPPGLFPSHFGPHSFAKHQADAARAGALVSVVRNPRIEMDVDDEPDLCALLRCDLSGLQTGRFLRDSGLAEKFAEGTPIRAAGG